MPFCVMQAIMAILIILLFWRLNGFPSKHRTLYHMVVFFFAVWPSMIEIGDGFNF